MENPPASPMELATELMPSFFFFELDNGITEVESSAWFALLRLFTTAPPLCLRDRSLLPEGLGGVTGSGIGRPILFVEKYYLNGPLN